MSSPSTPREEIDARMGKLQDALRKARFDAALIVQRADLFYFSGTGQDAHLFVPAEGSPVLLARKSFERAREDSPLDMVEPVRTLRDIKKRMALAPAGSKPRIGMELDVLPVNMYRTYCDLFDDAVVDDVSPILREIRMIKSEYELGLLRSAALLNERMYNMVPEIVREGMPEIELAGLIEAFYRKNGHQGVVRVRSFNGEVFYGHIMSGMNLAVPSCSVGPTGGPGVNASMPQGVGLRPICADEPIHIDYVSVIGGYMVDQSRIFCLGEIPDRIRRIHETALHIQNTLAELGRAGSSAEALYNTALDIARESGYSKGFMGFPLPVSFVGHGVGIELDELPVIGKKSPHTLSSGMVIALEPKFIVPDIGLAGIENTFVVTETGMKKLTLFTDDITLLPRAQSSRSHSDAVRPPA